MLLLSETSLINLEIWLILSREVCHIKSNFDVWSGVGLFLSCCRELVVE